MSEHPNKQQAAESIKHAARLLGKRAVTTVAFASTLWALGCGGKYDPPGPQPVEECVAYEAAVRRCMHQDVAIATQPAFTAVTEAEKARIRAMCNENLARIERACR
jgi:hypothetical protein